MPDKPVSILFTRSTDQGIIDRAASFGIRIRAIPFIRTVESSPEELDALRCQLVDTDVLVFTSANAVRALAPVPDGRRFRIFCLSGATLQAARERFPRASVLGSSDHAEELAARILGHGDIRQLQFFCGNLHLPALPEQLGTAGLQLNEHIVYRTELSPVRLEESFDGIAFFSPSAVQSYLSMNTVDPDLSLFAIGHTTAAALAGLRNQLIVSPRPFPDALLNTIIEFYRPGTVPNQPFNA